MQCTACGAAYQPGDRFCGTCGDRLSESAPPPAVSPAAAPTSTAPPAPAPIASGERFEAGGRPENVAAPVSGAPAAVCPVCGSPLAVNAARCEVCHFEPGASVLIPGRPPVAAAPEPPAAPPALPPLEAGAAGLICPVHGPLNPTWTRCPHCLKEGREGRLPSGPLPARAVEVQSAPPARPEPAHAPPVEAPAREEPPAAVIPARAAPPPAAAPAPPARPPLGAPQPQSSVGATFAVRRRSRLLAYLIEKEGETTGRVHQLNEDTTDIGRDPRNHITLSDEKVSGFHARVERGPDDGFLALDRGSTNGSFLNDAPLKDLQPFRENDELRMGSTVLVLKIVE